MALKALLPVFSVWDYKRMEKYLGIDLGGTNVKVAITDKTGNIYGSASVKTLACDDPEVPVRQIEAGVKAALENAGLQMSDIKAAGFGIPGNGVWPKGEVIICPNIGWNHFDAVGRLESILGVPVFMGNDADCMALAENSFGAGKNYRAFLMITLGTGVGGAFVMDGKPFVGAGPCAGEFGYIPLVHGGYESNSGLNGCLEEYCSIRGMERLAMKEGFPEHTGPKRVFRMLEEGNPAAERVVDAYTDLLAEGLTGLINIFRPEVILLGGGMANAGASLFDRLNEKIPKMTYANDSVPAPKVTGTVLGTYAGALGAAVLAME